MRSCLLTGALLLSVASLHAQSPRNVPIDEFDTEIQQQMESGRLANDALMAQRRQSMLAGTDQYRSTVKLSKKARKDFQQGGEALQRRDFPAAQKFFAAVIAEQPDFAGGHLNLGVAEMDLSHLAAAKSEFEQAARLEPQLALAYQDIGVVEIESDDFVGAESALKSANRLAPKDLKTLTLLAYSQAQNREFDNAIATAHRVHLDPNHAGYAFAHIIAGAALQSAGRLDEAAGEYELFLKETPNDPRAGVARKALLKLRADAKNPNH